MTAADRDELVEVLAGHTPTKTLSHDEPLFCAECSERAQEYVDECKFDRPIEFVREAQGEPMSTDDARVGLVVAYRLEAADGTRTATDRATAHAALIDGGYTVGPDLSPVVAAHKRLGVGPWERMDPLEVVANDRRRLLALTETLADRLAARDAEHREAWAKVRALAEEAGRSNRHMSGYAAVRVVDLLAALPADTPCEVTR